MFIEYFPGTTLLHKLDVRTKLLGFIVITATAFMFTSPLVNSLLVVFCLLLLWSSKTPMDNVIKLIKPLLPIFLIMIVLTGFSYSTSNFKSPAMHHVWFQLFSNKIEFTSGGFFYGVTLLLRILIMVLLSTVITYTTPIEDILQFLKKMRLPHQLAFVIATGIRFIPTMEKKTRMVMDAQRARGHEFNSGGMIKRIRSFIPVLIPVIVDSIRMSDNLAISMLNRGFGAMDTTTDLVEIKMKNKDYWMIVFEVVILAIAIWAKTLNYGVL